MKILYLNSGHYDYMQDVMYSGLVKVLGAKNIKTLPFNKSYAFNFKTYPKNLGHIDDIKTSYLLSYIRPFRYDCVIVAAAKRKPFEYFNKIATAIPKNIPVVFLDGGDVDWVGGDMQRLNCLDLYNKALTLREFDIILKREMIIGKTYDKHVHPCTFAFNLDRIPKNSITKKKYDVSFWAVESHEIRTQALTLLENKYDCKENGTTLKQRFKEYKRKGEFYLQELQASKIVLNFRGGGWDTLRYWEVPALSTCMISQKPHIQIINEFTDGENIVYCKDDLSDLIELIDYYLKNETKREEIAKRSFAHLHKYHTDVERAKYLLKKIDAL